MKLIIGDTFGLHARVATQLINLFEKYEAQVNIVFKQKRAKGYSILQMMQLGTKKGDEITIEYIVPPKALNQFETELRNLIER